MKVLSTIITGSDILILLVLISVPVAFFKSLPTTRGNWRDRSLGRRAVTVVTGILAIVCAIQLFSILWRESSIAKEEGRQNIERGVAQRLRAVESLLSRYVIDFGELPKGNSDEIWQTILSDERFRYDWQKFENEYLRTNSEGILIDRWGNQVRFRHESENQMQVYSAGFDKTFSTVDDIPKLWEPTSRETLQVD